jgi:hypothetical protein
MGQPQESNLGTSMDMAILFKGELIRRQIVSLADMAVAINEADTLLIEFFRGKIFDPPFSPPQSRQLGCMFLFSSLEMTKAERTPG